MKKIILAGLLAVSPFAHALTDPAFDRFMASTVGNKTTVNFGSNGTALAGARNATIVKSLEAGGYTVGRNFAVSAAGSTVNMAATLPISRVATARMFNAAAIASGARFGLPGILAMTAAPYVYDWLKGEGVTVNPAGDLEKPWLIDFEETGYTCKVGFGSTLYGPAPTCSGAMAMAVAAVNKFVTIKVTDSTCDRSPTNQTAPCQYFTDSWRPAYHQITMLPPSTNQREATTDEVVGLLSASTQWPAPDLIKSLIEAGAKLEPELGDNVTVVGDTRGTPYNVMKSTKTDQTGTTDLSTDCVREYLYDKNTYETKEVCVTTTTKPDGTKTTETVSKPATDSSIKPATPASGADPGTETETETEDGTVTDTPFLELPVLYTRKYPDGLTGVWKAKIKDIKATPLFSLSGSLMPNVGSAGSCPTMPINFSVASWADFGTFDVAPPCWIWDFGKTVIIISALLLARRLIFGG